MHDIIYCYTILSTSEKPIIIIPNAAPIQSSFFMDQHKKGAYHSHCYYVVMWKHSNGNP